VGAVILVTVSSGVYKCEAMLVSSWPCCDVGSKRIIGVKVNPDLEVLFRLMDGLRADNGRRHWISEHVIKMNTCDKEEDLGHAVTEVKITLPKSHNILTIAEEHIQ
jgi:hypothetical protein